jgi:hypothetical protein
MKLLIGGGSEYVKLRNEEERGVLCLYGALRSVAAQLIT